MLNILRLLHKLIFNTSRMLSCFSRVWLFVTPMDCSPSGSSVHGDFLARILEWVVMPSSRGSSWPKDRACTFCIAGRSFTAEPLGKPDTSRQRFNNRDSVPFLGPEVTPLGLYGDWRSGRSLLSLWVFGRGAGGTWTRVPFPQVYRELLHHQVHN